MWALVDIAAGFHILIGYSLQFRSTYIYNMVATIYPIHALLLHIVKCKAWTIE
jgi:hypothetical protein